MTQHPDATDTASVSRGDVAATPAASETGRLVRVARLRDLHASRRLFVVPNPWDMGSARILASLGFVALATTSAGYAFSQGKRDCPGELTRDEIIENAAQIADATPLPVTADLQNGFGDRPEDCVATVRDAARAGLAGGSIEDATGDPTAPVYEFAEAVDRVVAAAEAARGTSFVLTARAESFLFGQGSLPETIARLQAFVSAGADVVYAPGLPDLDAIRTVCHEIDAPVNVVMGLRGATYSLDQLAEAGVSRVSVGGSFARAALGGLTRAAREVLDTGTFTYTEQALPGTEITQLLTPLEPWPDRACT